MSETYDDTISLLHKRTGTALTGRAETVRVMKALMGQNDTTMEQKPEKRKQQRPPLSNVCGEGPMILSDIPESSKEEGVIVGIDEAGRGSVLGPMIYGAAYWNASEGEKVSKEFHDSKQLTEEKRASLLDEILDKSPFMGFAVRVLHASEISRNMLRAEPYNLNQMSHDAAFGIIRQLLKAGVKIETCYIDTVGNPASYKRRLENEFPGLDFVVESKADAKYAPCSAASVVAKVVRDRMLESWEFSEPLLAEASKLFGSGYPSDPTCKKWMEDNLNCKIFGYPDVVRFSWGPAKKALEKDAIAVAFEADEDEEEDDNAVKRQREQMSIFLGKQSAPTRKRVKRYPFFERRKLEAVTKM